MAEEFTVRVAKTTEKITKSLEVGFMSARKTG
jgi:hypothetical protein